MMDPASQDLKNEIQRLKVEITSTPRSSPIAAMKYVILVAGIKDWTGDSRGRTVYEFFSHIDTYAKVSNWSEEEKVLIAKAKLQHTECTREILANDLCSYAVLREYLTEKYREMLSAQYHYTRLQDTIQEKGENVEEFADRLGDCAKRRSHLEGH
jgi:hypothetical protein